MQPETIAVGAVLLAIIGLLLFKFNGMKEERDTFKRELEIKSVEHSIVNEALNDVKNSREDLRSRLNKQGTEVTRLTASLEDALSKPSDDDVATTRKLVIGQLRRSFPTLAADVKTKLGW